MSEPPDSGMNLAAFRGAFLQEFRCLAEEWQEESADTVWTRPAYYRNALTDLYKLWVNKVGHHYPSDLAGDVERLLMSAIGLCEEYGPSTTARVVELDNMARGLAGRMRALEHSGMGCGGDYRPAVVKSTPKPNTYLVICELRKGKKPATIFEELGVGVAKSVGNIHKIKSAYKHLL